MCVCVMRVRGYDLAASEEENGGFHSRTRAVNFVCVTWVAWGEELPMDRRKRYGPSSEHI